MAANKLTAAQRDDVLRRIAAGENHATIAEAVGCSLQNVRYHASRAKPQLETVKAERKAAAISAGLSEVDARVAQLEWLNGQIAEDLATGMYGVDVKLSATGRTVEVPAFKAQQVAQLRGTLDDIAKERGGRKTSLKVDGDLNVTHTYADILAAAEAEGGGRADDHQP